jgi:mevalonate kinase
MPAFSAYAPGKTILFGEHAVVYGRPAIAVPVTQLRARVMVEAALRAPTGQIWVQAPEVELDSSLQDLPSTHPVAAAVNLVIAALSIQKMPACRIRISSTIPVAAGLGSGAAVAVALIRALSGFLGHPLQDERVCELAYEIERIHHGTPSGIDNTVVTLSRPIYFTKGQPFQVLKVQQPFILVIGDTGVRSPTAQSVGEVRRLWQAQPAVYETYFDQIEGIVDSARVLIEKGIPKALGPLMNENHAILQNLGVSSPELERLVQVACQAGAWGAKLSGGGRGGNMIALVSTENAQTVASALEQAGGKRTLITEIS